MGGGRLDTLANVSALHGGYGGAVERDVDRVEGFRAWVGWEWEGEVCEGQGWVRLEG